MTLYHYQYDLSLPFGLSSIDVFPRHSAAIPCSEMMKKRVNISKS